MEETNVEVVDLASSQAGEVPLSFDSQLRFSSSSNSQLSDPTARPRTALPAPIPAAPLLPFAIQDHLALPPQATAPLPPSQAPLHTLLALLLPPHPPPQARRPRQSRPGHVLRLLLLRLVFPLFLSSPYRPHPPRPFPPHGRQGHRSRGQEALSPHGRHAGRGEGASSIHVRGLWAELCEE